MTTQVTQCPKCNTSFRVTDAQLSIANGAVRCGSCLHIFNAAEHWLDAQTAPQAPQPDLVTPEPDDSFDLDDSMTIDEHSLDHNFEDSELTEDSYFDQLADQQPNAAPTDPQPPAADFSTDNPSAKDDSVADNHEASIDIDEFLASNAGDALLDDELLIGDTKAHSIINTEHDLYDLDEDDDRPVANNEFSRFFLELDEQTNKPSSVFRELDEFGDDSDNDEDSWAKKLLDDDERENTAEQATVSDHDVANASSPEHPEDPFEDLLDKPENAPSADQPDPDLLDLLDEHSNQPPISEDEFTLGNESLLADERIGHDNSALLANIEPAAMAANAQQPDRWIKRATLAGTVLAMFLLAGQYIAFNFDRLARDEHYRPLLGSACTVLPCKLPELNDTRLIRSTNLMVRSHPKLQQALVVDAIMTNHADFKQQFPIMELLFTDLDGEVIAGRRFEPAEYLAGELTGQQWMPIKQPIHIALEIVDPGEQAVNYQLRFYPLR